MQPRVAYPYPSQTNIFHPSQKKNGKITTLAGISVSNQDQNTSLARLLGLKTTPFPDRNCEKHTLEATERVEISRKGKTMEKRRIVYDDKSVVLSQ